jgi:hypothetical protein
MLGASPFAMTSVLSVDASHHIIVHSVEESCMQVCMMDVGCWLVVKLGTPQDRRPDRSDERQILL